MTLGFMPVGAYPNPILSAWQNGIGTTGNTIANGMNRYQYPLLDFANGKYLIPKFSAAPFSPFGSGTTYIGEIPIFALPKKKSKQSAKAQESQGFFESAWSGIKSGYQKVKNFVTGLGKSIINTAAKYLGFNESNGSYKKFTHGRTEAWCADFVTYVVKEAFRRAGKALPAGFGSPSVSCLMDWGKQAKRWVQLAGRGNRASIVKNNIKPGDIIIFKSAGASHTGIVERIAADGTIHTIEGNTSDKVARRHYSPNKATITGFIKMA